MTHRVLVGRDYRDGLPIELQIDNGVIRQRTSISADEEFSTASQGQLPWLAPALVDLQINGMRGDEFVSGEITPERFGVMCHEVVRLGVTRFCPTLTTQSDKWLLASFETMGRAIDNDVSLQQLVLGFHLEGPYISAEEGPRGAHPIEHCRPPDWDEFSRWQEASGGRIGLVTLSPEYSSSNSFISNAVKSGVRISIGHTAANSDQIRAAVDAGATASTHLGNGAHATIKRHPNYIWDQLAEDRLIACLIADGQHLPGNFLKVIAKCKGLEKVILVSDVTGLAGMSPGRYSSLSLGEIEVMEDGRLTPAGKPEYLAGASRSLWRGVCNMASLLELPMSQILPMATHQPASYLGAPAYELDAGSPADLLVISSEPDGSIGATIESILWRGETVAPSSLLDR